MPKLPAVRKIPLTVAGLMARIYTYFFARLRGKAKIEHRK
jgi:hypothetical protein